MSRMTDLLDLSHVPRWTTHPMNRHQSVAEHCYRVQVIAINLYDLISEKLVTNSHTRMEYRNMVIEWSMVHDAPEVFTGDIPSPAKKQIGDRFLAEVEAGCCPWWFEVKGKVSRLPYAVVRLADSIEALSWVAKYGDGANCRFEHVPIEQQIRSRIHDEAASYNMQYPGIHDGVKSILGEVAP